MQQRLLSVGPALVTLRKQTNNKHHWSHWSSHLIFSFDAYAPIINNEMHTKDKDANHSSLSNNQNGQECQQKFNFQYKRNAQHPKTGCK